MLIRLIWRSMIVAAPDRNRHDHQLQDVISSGRAS
jgi:hypothetical protein